MRCPSTLLLLLHAAVSVCSSAAAAAPPRLVLGHRRTKLQDALHAELSALGATEAGEWGLYGWDDASGQRPVLVRSAGFRLLLDRLAHAESLAALIPAARTLGLAESGWTLRIEDLSPPCDAAPRGAALCALAQTIRGAPALDASGGGDDAAGSLLLLRGSKLGYLLARVAAAQPEALQLDGSSAAAWRRRPYKFDAASDYVLARVMVSLCGGELGRHVLYDPCAGSGTLLFAAASLGFAACGTDINERQVEGAAANLRAALHGEPVPPRVALQLHDVRAPFGDALQATLPPAAEAAGRVRVLSNLPWGTNWKLPAEDYLHDLLRGVARRLPGARGCYGVGSDPKAAAALLEEAGFAVLDAIPVGNRTPRKGEQRAPLCTLVVAVAPAVSRIN